MRGAGVDVVQKVVGKGYVTVAPRVIRLAKSGVMVFWHGLLLSFRTE
jgi:hypothetical protein